MQKDSKKKVVTIVVPLIIGAALFSSLSIQNLLEGDSVQEHRSSSNKPAHFENGTTTWLKTFSIDPNGGTWEVDDLSTAVSSITIAVPANTVLKETEVSVGYNDGDLYLQSGQEGGLVVVLHAETDVFKKAVMITVKSDDLTRKGVPVGYAIQKGGRLSPMDAVWDKPKGELKFYTFRPDTIMTWVYAK